MGNYEPTLEELCEIDNAGEAELKQYYRENGYKVKDVSLDRYYQVRDTDILVLINGKWVGIEIKYDSRIHETNNLYFEVYNEEKHNGLGWTLFTKTDLLAYGDSYNKLYYIFNFNDLKSYVLNNKPKFKMASYDKSGYTSQAYLIPLQDLLEQNLILETIKLN